MDTILYNGVIHTMAGRTVSALAIQKGRVALAGEDASALALATPETRRIDLEGRCVLPGFTDSHMHMLLTGLGFRRLDLRGVSSVEELVERGRAYVARQSLAPGEWVIGYGFDHNRFPVPVLPDGAAAEALRTVGFGLLCAFPVWLGSQALYFLCFFSIRGSTAAAFQRQT